MRQAILGGVIAATTLSMVPHAVSACGFHGLLGSGFSAQHPGSIDVAIALRDAADHGIIDAASLAPKPADMFAYHRTVQRLQKLTSVLADKHVEGMPSFSLLLVESALWSRYSTDDAKVSVAVHTTGAKEGEPVVLTGEAVIVAIEAGRLSWDDAVRRNLIVIVPS